MGGNSAQRPRIERYLLPYNDRLEKRVSGVIDLVVVHCTELPSMIEAREYGERIHHAGSQTGNSGHYYVDRDGTLTQYVEDTRVAHHVRGWNEASLGIELVHQGRFPNWYDSRHQEIREPYPAAQIDALVDLLCYLHQRYPTIRRLAAHSDLDRTLLPAEDDPRIQIRRKVDPGPTFPWPEVTRRGGLPRWIQGQ